MPGHTGQSVQNFMTKNPSNFVKKSPNRLFIDPGVPRFSQIFPDFHLLARVSHFPWFPAWEALLREMGLLNFEQRNRKLPEVGSNQLFSFCIYCVW